MARSLFSLMDGSYKIQLMIKMAKAAFSDKIFHKKMTRIALPIIVQMLLINGLTLVDTMMVGRLGELPVAAVGLASQMFFLVFLAFFGISNGTSVFASQFWGNRDMESIHHIIGLSLFAVALIAIPFTLSARLIPRELMRVFSPDLQVVDIGTEYLRIISFSYILTGFSFVLSSVLRSMERPGIPLIATAISMGLNTCLNIVLIFGYLGFPAMGVRGAALATVISRFVELVVIVGFVLSRKIHLTASIRRYLGFDRTLVKQFIVITGPVIINELIWALGIVVYKMIFARMGTDVIAAANITDAIQSLFWVILIGTSNTASIMIGKRIGEGNLEEATLYARYFAFHAIFLGICLGLLMSLTAPAIILFLNMKESTIHLIRLTLIVVGFFVPFRSMNFHIGVGVLRSGGDTVFVLLIDSLSVWLIGVPLALLTGIGLGWSLPIISLMIGLEDVAKCSVFLRRLLSDKWIKDLRRTGTENSSF